MIFIGGASNETVVYKGIIGLKLTGHREIINRYAEMGYRYVGYIPTELNGGALVTVDLIFEKDV